MAKPCKVLASPAYQTLTRAASASAAPPLTAAYVIRHQPSHQAPVSTTKCQRGWRWTHCRAAGRCLLHMPDHLGASQSSTSSSRGAASPKFPGVRDRVGELLSVCPSGTSVLEWGLVGWSESKQRDLNASPAAASSYPPLWGRPVARSESRARISSLPVAPRRPRRHNQALHCSSRPTSQSRSAPSRVMEPIQKSPETLDPTGLY